MFLNEILILSPKHLKENMNSYFHNYRNQDYRSKLLLTNLLVLAGGTFIYCAEFLYLYHKRDLGFFHSSLPLLVLKPFFKQILVFFFHYWNYCKSKFECCLFFFPSVKGNICNNKIQVTDLPPNTTSNAPSVNKVGVS